MRNVAERRKNLKVSSNRSYLSSISLLLISIFQRPSRRCSRSLRRWYEVLNYGTLPKFQWLHDLVEPDADQWGLAWTITIKHQILMMGDSRRGKSIWPTDHHLRGCSIVPVYTVQHRILLPHQRVAVSLLKQIALLVGPSQTSHITQGNTRLQSPGVWKPNSSHPWSTAQLHTTQYQRWTLRMNLGNI